MLLHHVYLGLQNEVGFSVDRILVFVVVSFFVCVDLIVFRVDRVDIRVVPIDDVVNVVVDVVFDVVVGVIVDVGDGASPVSLFFTEFIKGYFPCLQEPPLKSSKSKPQNIAPFKPNFKIYSSTLWIMLSASS